MRSICEHTHPAYNTAMNAWFFQTFPPQSVALTMLIVSLAGATGLALGSLKFKGISLGIPGVMFTAMIATALLPKQHNDQPLLNEAAIIMLRDFIG